MAAVIEPPFLEMSFWGAERSGVQLLDPAIEELIVEGDLLMVRRSGAAFCGPFPPRPNQEAGLEVYRRFRALASSIRPTYGAILVEMSLPRPDEMTERGTSMALRNFYVSTDLMGEVGMARISKVMAPAYEEQWAHGRYWSMSSYFNPLSRALPNEEGWERSRAVATMMGLVLTLSK